MPRFDWASAGSANPSGSVFTIPNGGYVCTITDAEWGNSTNGQPRLKIVWDIAEGPYANVCDNNGWYDSKHCDYISFAPSALRFAAGKLDAITASNPGFDAKAAVDNDAFYTFVGRRVGLVLKVEYGEWQGRQTKKMKVDSYKTVDDIHAGRFTVPEDEQPPAVPQQAPTHVPPTFGQTVGGPTQEVYTGVYTGPAPF